MSNNDRKPYEVPGIQELGELHTLTQNGKDVNSDTAAFPANNNPSNAFGPYS